MGTKITDGDHGLGPSRSQVGGAWPSGDAIRGISDILALGYLRYRKRLATDRARKAVRTAENPLDDVAPRGRVPSPENRTPEMEVE